MYAIKFDTSVEKTISKWKRSNPLLHKKLLKVLMAIAENPRSGIGHPEPLVGGGGTIWSRHISAHDRIIYSIHDKEVFVIVVEIQGHYGDK